MPSPQLRILVPLQDPSTEDGLVRLAASLASPPWGELHLTHVVTPDSSPPAEISSLLQRAADIPLEMGIGAIPHLEEGEEVTQVIEQAISRWNCNMMLMGWQAEVERDAILAAKNRDLTKAMGVDTLIFKDRGLDTP
ncbi:MAG: universal stress protein, partial [Gemmatimonadetes bacterium]|nr:universal stress protein [Gemmatimonadota bacterium]